MLSESGMILIEISLIMVGFALVILTIGNILYCFLDYSSLRKVAFRLMYIALVPSIAGIVILALL